DRFADHFNAAQLATGPALAVAGNSPTFLGHRLWEETRVALFKQAVDDRDPARRPSRGGSGVGLGTGWTRSGPLELLEESVRLHEPVLPVVGPERPLDRLGQGGGGPAPEGVRLAPGAGGGGGAPAPAAGRAGPGGGGAGPGGAAAAPGDGGALDPGHLRPGGGRTSPH